MEELLELRQHLLNGEYSTALAMIDELGEMSRKAILRTIRAYLVRLLVHLIKNQHEERLTKFDQFVGCLDPQFCARSSGIK